MQSHDDEVLPQRKPRQRRCNISPDESIPPNDNSTEAEIDTASADRKRDLLTLDDDLRNEPEDPCSTEFADLEEERMGEQPSYRSAAEGNFLFECEK